jgi:hypothetical protein
MNMKYHLLSALREKFNDWEALLSGLSEEQRIAPTLPDNWSVKDVVAHVDAWLQRTVARLEAAQQHREPIYPKWTDDPDPDAEGITDKTNAWIYDHNHDLPWNTVYQNWRRDFLRLLELADGISEMELLDSSRFSWMEGHALSAALVASYDHHQEHYEKLQARLHITEKAKSNPALTKLQPFIGEWQSEARQNGQPIGQGKAVFEWLEGGAFLIQRTTAEPPFPSATGIIGADDTTGAYCMVYSDSRLVTRIYQMSLSDNVWTLWRDDPDFPQRFTGTLSADGRTITGAWEKKSEDGSHWEKDFDLTYTKL